MSETLLRQWELLRAIPRAPRKADVAMLRARLASAGYRITPRTLQRDLQALSRVFPLQSDERTIPYGWSWAADAPAFDVPTMDGATALTMRMIEQFIPTLLPPIVREQLAPQFERARTVLNALETNPLGRWLDCVRVIPQGMTLLPPKFDGQAVRVVYDALLAGKRFTMRYQSREREERSLRDYEVNPLGLVVRGHLIYLIATLWEYEDIRQLALHRMTNATLLEKPAVRPVAFDLDEYIKEGELQFRVGHMIRLEAIFDRGAAAHLYEMPLSQDQVIEDLDEGHVRVTATVMHTKQLEWWLRGFGSHVRVVAPTRLSKYSDVTGDRPK